MEVIDRLKMTECVTHRGKETGSGNEIEGAIYWKDQYTMNWWHMEFRGGIPCTTKKHQHCFFHPFFSFFLPPASISWPQLFLFLLLPFISTRYAHIWMYITPCNSSQHCICGYDNMLKWRLHFSSEMFERGVGVNNAAVGGEWAVEERESGPSTRSHPSISPSTPTCLMYFTITFKHHWCRS